MNIHHFDPDVSAVLQRLLSDVSVELGAGFVGLYAHGSLAYGDYDPARSDLDLLVVTTTELPVELHLALRMMHERITASGMARASNMEVSYIPLAALRRYERANCQHPALRADGTFGVDGHGSEWVIQRYIIREKGVALAGPDPRTLIDSITADDLRVVVRELPDEWWAPQLADPFRMRSDEYQAYAILTMCRMLYTIEQGSIVSKPTAARWAQAVLEMRWSALVARAAAWQHGDVMDAFDESLAMVAFTLERIHGMGMDGKKLDF